MSNILIAYMSLTGNTETIAEAIHSGLGGDVRLAPIKEVEGTESFDLIFIGFPVHSHSVPAPAERFLKSIPRGKKIALFSTHGSLSGSRLSREALEHASIIAAQGTILGSFSCRGKVSAKAMEVFSRSPENRVWAEMAVTARTHPDEHDIADAGTFARWIQTLYHQS
jgi:flavodoxin